MTIQSNTTRLLIVIKECILHYYFQLHFNINVNFTIFYFTLLLFSLMPPHIHTSFRVPPSWLWQKCNRLLRLGRPWGAVTLSWWCEGWYIGRWGARRGLKSKSTKLPRPWSPRGSSPYKENSHGRAGNRTWDLVISSQKLWPLDHELAGQNCSLKKDCRGTKDRTPKLHSPVICCFRHNRLGFLLQVNLWTVANNSYSLWADLCYLHTFPDTCRLTEPVYALWGIRPLDLS